MNGNNENMENTPNQAEESNTRTFLTFMANDLIYAVDTSYVVEIITNYSPRALPMVPEYIQGLINLRGQVIPVIDFRLRLGCYDIPPSNSCVILQNDSTTIGLIVDRVSQTLDIDLKKSLSIPVESKQELTNGMVTLENGTVILILNFEALIA